MEEEIIDNFKKNMGAMPEGILGIGDDAAVVPGVNGTNYVICKDLLVESVHFRMDYYDPETLAHKALHVNLSDVAAMGASPHSVLLGLAMPASIKMSWVKRFSDAFTRECKLHNIVLIGGDTTRSESNIFISVTMMGLVSSTSIKCRQGAQDGNIICVVGTLGEAYAGLIALENKRDNFINLKNKSRCPTALIKEGVWLGSQSAVTAMMDISDGLYADLYRLIKSSSVGAALDLENLCPSGDLQSACEILNLDVMKCMLCGGEDYALLFTVSQERVDQLSEKFEAAFGYKIQQIGKIISTAGLHLKRNGIDVPFEDSSFRHFGTD